MSSLLFVSSNVALRLVMETGFNVCNVLISDYYEDDDMDIASDVEPISKYCEDASFESLAGYEVILFMEFYLLKLYVV